MEVNKFLPWVYTPKTTTETHFVILCEIFAILFSFILLKPMCRFPHENDRRHLFHLGVD